MNTTSVASEREKLQMSIRIDAPREKVWQVLIQDELNRKWYAQFMEGSYAETDWQVGSKALFKDASGEGLVSKVVANQPNEVVSIRHEGVLANGIEDRESPEARKWAGSMETYRLTGQEGNTVLSVEQDVPANYLKSFSEMWDKALRKIKELAESV